MITDPSYPNKSSIDFNNNIPYYVQLINLLKDKIDRNEWKPGAQIPGEMELCKEYGVSRTVVRQALRELEYKGIVYRRKGKGTFVAGPKINEGLAQKLTGFYHDMVERGLKPITQVLHQKVVPCDEKIAGFLQIRPGTKVIDIYRLRSIEDAPLQLVNTFIPYDICPQLAEIDLTNRSLYQFLEEECNVFISHGRRTIEAVAAREQDARLLQVEPGDPLIMLDSISYREDGRPVEYYHAVHRGDRTRFEVELVRYHNPDQKKVENGGLKIDELPPSNPINKR